MIDKNKVKVEQSSVKTADPGVYFKMYGEDNTIFDCALDVDLHVHVEVTGGNYYSSVSIKQRVTESEIDFLIPFGDGDWVNEVGHVVKIRIRVYLKEVQVDGKLSGNVVAVPYIDFDHEFAQNGKFVVTVEAN